MDGFNSLRLFIIGGLICGAACRTLATLTDLHLANDYLVQDTVREPNIEMEKLPAQRGLILDCNEKVLTNNIQTSEIVADRYHLRSINVVVEGLAYNAATHDPSWSTLTEKGREKLIRDKQDELFKLAKIESTQEEREKIRELREMGHEIPNVDKEEYKPEICANYYREHDKLIAEILYPFLGKDRKDHKGRVIKGLSMQDIIDLIEQPEVAAQEQTKGGEKKRYRKRIFLAKDLGQEQGAEIKNALERAHIRGLMVQGDSWRFYAEPTMLSHVLGRVNYEKKGESGVELTFDSYLRGIDGLREYRRDPRGKVASNEDDRYIAPQHGLNLRLTIDMRIQRIVEDELDKNMRRFRAKKGCVIVVEPQTGNILAMVSRPSSDLNTMDVITPFGRLSLGNTAGPGGKALGGEYNFATQARYEPGSTMKVVTATTAIDKGLFTINSVVSTSDYSANGAFKTIGQGGFHYGPLPIWGVLKKSSNPGTARVAIACKWPNFKEYVEKYGLTTSTDICIPSGGKCLLTDGSKLVNLSRMSYGYSISVSPLHMAMIYATISNKGVRMKPRLIDKIIAQDGSVYDECSPEVACRVMKESTAKDLLFALHHVTLNEKPSMHGRGTATMAAIPGIEVGGKTGTAWKSVGTSGYKNNRVTVSFAGVFPIKDPRYVIMTVIDEPVSPDGRGIGGVTVAAPIFRRIATRLIKEFDIPLDDEKAFQEFCIADAKKEEEQMKKAATFTLASPQPEKK